MQRTLFVTAPFMIAILLYLGLSAVDQGEFQAPVATDSIAEEFEAYSEGLNTLLFNSDGTIDYTLQATRQVHYSDNHSEFEDPWLRLYDIELGDWNIVADSGTISGSGTQNESIGLIELVGNVEALRLDSTGSRLQLLTDRLSVNPAEDTLYTESAVSLLTDAITQSATGMRANMTQEEIVFLRNVQGRYEIPAN